MPAYVLIIDLLGLVLVVTGFCMAFRQDLIRRIFGWRSRPAVSARHRDDPITYILRIAGIMLMAFGVAIGGMFTFFTLFSGS